VRSFLPMLTLAALLVACSHNAPLEQPAPVLPQAWNTMEGASPASVAGERWWNLFGDPVLDKLVDESLQHNHDLEAAAARVLEAEARLGIVDAARYPEVNANGEGYRRKLSEATDVPLFDGMPRYENNLRLTLDASYEVDVWGKYRRASDAARAQLLATQSASDTVRLTLTADVAQQYFNLLAADAQVAVLRVVLKSRQDSLELLRARLSNGVGSDYDIRQAEGEVFSVRSQLIGALKAQEDLESVLAILLGRSPREVMQGMVERGQAKPLQTLWVPDGLPSDLLLRRPDIREAEQKLLAEDANIDVARAEFFPSISLTAYLGTSSASLGDLFSGPASIFQFFLGLSQPIFNAGRIEYSVKAAEARRSQALAGYKKAVSNAFGDVRSVLNAQTAGRDTLQAESGRVAALAEAQRLANVRYLGGVSSRLEVLDAERQLLQAQLARIDAENAQRVAVVSLFKALGGGWKQDNASVVQAE
jgi:outer membrane protein, multidrug efflux system